jgi:hypothetical protein
MTSALHHLFALEVMSLIYGHDRTSTALWDVATHLVGCAGRSHFALHSYALTEYIEVICLRYNEALSYGYVLNWKPLIFMSMLYFLFL